MSSIIRTIEFERHNSCTGRGFRIPSPAEMKKTRSGGPKTTCNARTFHDVSSAVAEAPSRVATGRYSESSAERAISKPIPRRGDFAQIGSAVKLK